MASREPLSEMAHIIAQAALLLRQLSPADIASDEAAELREVGLALFGRLAIKQAYGEKDVVEFLREQAGHRTLLKRLEKLQKQINAEHDRRCTEAQSAGINRARQATMQAIEAASAEANDDDAAVELIKQSTDHAGTSAPHPSEPCSELAMAPPSVAAPPSGPPRLPPRASIDAAVSDAGEVGSAVASAARLPVGSFRRACGVCKRSYADVHDFYHRLCPTCAEFNLAKRLQSANLGGYVALVTGGRVRIGCAIVLRPDCLRLRALTSSDELCSKVRDCAQADDLTDDLTDALP